MADDTFYMKQALMEAQKAFASGEVPVALLLFVVTVSSGADTT